MSEVEFDFKGKNFAVMGASSGIGKQITLELLNAGANVLALARRKELMDEVYKDYREQIVTAKLDVCNQDNLNAVLKDFVSVKGKFDGSVYTAGTSDVVSLRHFEEETAHNIMNTNFFGAFAFLSRLNTASYVNRGSSHVWIASIAAHMGTQGSAFYSASKGAMLASLKTMAIEISKKKHRINIVSPGWIQTPMTQDFSDQTGFADGERSDSNRYLLGNDGRPDDISGAVLFLLSDRARWITGTEIIIDGGCLAS